MRNTFRVMRSGSCIDLMQNVQFGTEAYATMHERDGCEIWDWIRCAQEFLVQRLIALPQSCFCAEVTLSLAHTISPAGPPFLAAKLSLSLVVPRHSASATVAGTYKGAHLIAVFVHVRHVRRSWLELQPSAGWLWSVRHVRLAH